MTQKTDYKNASKLIIKEIENVLLKVDQTDVDTLIKEILKADKVFMIAVGRVFLAMQCFCKRLVHLGVDANLVGAVNEKAFTPKDLLLVASGSGESVLPVVIAKKASKLRGRIGLITSADSSTIKSMSDFTVRLHCPTKNNKEEGVKSIQPMSTLFDQSLHIFGDIIALSLQDIKQLPSDELWKYHANLE